jgi:hypothetical protein
MLTPEQKAVLFFIIVCLGVILLGALTDRLKGRDVAQDMQEDEGGLGTGMPTPRPPCNCPGTWSCGRPACKFTGNRG